MGNNKSDEELEIVSPLTDKTNDEPKETTVEISQRIYTSLVEQAMYNFQSQQNMYSRYLQDDSSSGNEPITLNEYNQLALNPQDDYEKVEKINQKIRFAINSNDLIGKTYEIIESNVNGEIRLDFPILDVGKNSRKYKQKAKAEEVIRRFNRQVDLERIIVKAVPTVYTEGNCFLYLRGNSENYRIDTYPIGLIQVSNYELDGENILIMETDKLKNKLSNTMIKGKNGKNIFPFTTVEDEIKKNYPEEIAKAFSAKEKFAVLDVTKTGHIKINDLGRKYGISNIFKALLPLITLNNFTESNIATSKARRKKVLVQYMRKEQLGQSGQEPVNIESMAYAFQSMEAAFKAGDKGEMVRYTPPPTVEKVEYVNDKADLIDINLINLERNRIMTSLGIAFLSSDSKNSFSVSDISIKQLMRVINSITRQLERFIEKCYAVVLLENGIDLEFLPKLTIIDAELLEMQLKMELVDFMYSKLNCSYRTAYEILLGENAYDNEVYRRQEENESGIDEIFKAHITAHTASGKDPSGGDDVVNKDKKNEKSKENQNTDKNKQQTDKDRYKSKSK